MQFITVKSSYDRETTGVSSGYQLEIKKKSFENSRDEKFFNDFFKKNSKEFQRNVLNSFMQFNQEELIGSITLFPTSKKLKRIDFFRVCPNLMGIWVVVSQKVMNIFSKYNLPSINKIEIKIEGFSEKYYLIGFPIVSIECIDYELSKFMNIQSGKIIIYKTYENYKNREDPFDIYPKEIHLLENYKYDVLNLAGIYEISINSKILQDLKKENCIGFTEVDSNQIIVISPDSVIL
ncbi:MULTISPECIES: hypothetical protein [unclassified Pasteurella]|uniref:hypothetical protein n=1 Tax=unclassified Pasteurella TaxID=2621516 RepID=UPI0010733258|nr:hypothetical protein [Pasteurella sp. 19428wF3_WM03]TFU50991.1 hypothetical protein E4T92_06335 [Pasteurella sp. WM03]